MKRATVCAVVFVALVMALLGTAPPVGAIIGGEPDAAHPNVGAVIAFGETDPPYLGHCTGTLVTDRVVLSAAHCFAPDTWAPESVTRWCVNFEPDILHSDGNCRLTGQAFYDPRYDTERKKGNGLAQFSYQLDYDIGVVVLDRPASEVFPGIRPAPIVGPRGLDQFATGTRNRLFTEVGYGLQRELAPPVADGQFMDFTRNQTQTPLKKLTDLQLQLQGNVNDQRGGGGICSGDSGGPTFLGDTIVGVHSWGQTNQAGTCLTFTSSVRLDTESTRSYLRQFIPGL